MTRDKDGYTLTSGRHVYANCGFIGIPAIHDDKDNIWGFSEGYDGTISLANPEHVEYYKEQGLDYLITPTEAVEICDTMIKAWKHRKKLIESAVKP